MRGLAPSWTSLSIALVLSSYAVVLIAAKPTSISTLNRRGPDDDLPPELQPVPKDDQLPHGDSDKAIQEFDSDYQHSGYEDTEDWDPEQEPIDLPGDGTLINGLNKRVLPSPRNAATWVLRHVKIRGKYYIQAFDDNAKANKQKFVFLMGTRQKANKLKCVEDTKPLGKLAKHPGYERDHIQDLGAWTTIAKGSKPNDVTDGAWKTIKEAILGVSANNVSVHGLVIFNSY